MMHDGMPYVRNQGQGQGHSREVDRQSPTGLIFRSYIACHAPLGGQGKSFFEMRCVYSCVLARLS